MSISLEEFARRGGAAQSAVDLAIQRADLVARVSYERRLLDALGSRFRPPSPALDAATRALEDFDRALAGRAPRCWCGAVIYNGHHCENGHLQNRDIAGRAPA